MTADVLSSPALPLLLRLEAEGFEFAVDDDRLLVRPVNFLPPDARTQLAMYRRELLTLVRICDEGVKDRRAAFASQLKAGVSIGRLSLGPRLPYTAGRCFTCWDLLERPVFRRCWRCALAWRLAAGAPIAADVAAVYDNHREVA
jgi:hypothetical protein